MKLVRFAVFRLKKGQQLKLNTVQFLRGLAAILVVLFHLRIIREQMVFPGRDVVGLGSALLIENAYAGVDLFFVISGFIMVYVTADRSRGAATAGVFLASRAARIYPPWWLFAGLTTAYMLTFHVALNRDGLGWAAFADGAVAPGEHLLKSFALLPQAALPVLNVGWTLIHEMYFYAAFAVTLLVSRRWLGPMLAVWAGLVAGGAAAGLSAPYPTGFVSLALHPLTLEFILGAFAALAVQSGRRWRPALVTALASAAWVAALVFVAPPGSVLPEGAGAGQVMVLGHQIAFDPGAGWHAFMLEWGRVAAFGVPCAGLVYGLVSLEAEGRVKVWRGFVRLGDWSYALYLSHLLV
ncbi:MAG: acyltransferase, partial [Pseudomonadota bacterium]